MKVSMAGLSKSRLERMHRVLSGFVERKEMPGMVALVSHHDDVHVETLGTLAFDDLRAMQRDTIFRIASITKIVVAVAAMVLGEDCKCRLEDSIEPWLSSQLDDTVTVRDLLTYRMGFGPSPPIRYSRTNFWIGYVSRAAITLPMLPSQQPSMEEWLQKLGSLPLLAQPGERWMYHTSGDALATLIARVSGKTLGTFLLERIFEPLGMKDTAFCVPAEKIERLAAVYCLNRQKNQLDFFD